VAREILAGIVDRDIGPWLSRPDFVTPNRGPCSPTNVARQRDPMERGDACFETDIANVGLHFRPAHTPNEGFMQMQVIRLEDGLDWGLYKQVKSLG
jgi:hypothetical protein